MIIKRYLPQVYVVKKDESLFDICEGFKLNFDDVKKLNNIKKDVKENDVILLQEPKRNYYIVKPLDTIYSIANSLNLPVSTLIEKNNLTSNNIFIGQKLIF